MSASSLRFIHASDLHLERSLAGLRDIPEFLRDLLIEAPYQAAQRVFETAVLENVDFVLLAGDVIDARLCGPRGIAFLRDQLEMLDQHGIAVYWIGGQSEAAGRWPDTVRLPEGVHIFASSRVEEISHFRDEHPVATIAGQSWDGRLELRPGEYKGDRTGPPHIALAYGQCTEEELAEQHVTYWALGSEHNRRTVAKPPLAAHYCGATQGRSPREPGPHGCQVVTITASGEVRGTFAPTDSVRWRIERLAVKDKATLDDLRARMSERLTHVIGKEPGQTLLVRWALEANEPLARELARPKIYDSLLDGLRKEFGMGKSAAWSVAIDITPPDEVAADRFNEDTILGDFLRSAKQLLDEEKRSVPIEQLLSDDDFANRCAELITMRSPELRRQVLQQATLLGLDLLTGEEAITRPTAASKT